MYKSELITEVDEGKERNQTFGIYIALGVIPFLLGLLAFYLFLNNY